MNAERRFPEDGTPIHHDEPRVEDIGEKITMLVAEEVARESAPAPERQQRRRLFSYAILVFWVAFAFVTYLIRTLEPRSWDITVAQRLQSVRWRPLRLTLRHVSAPGFAPANFAIVAGTSILLWLGRLRLEAVLALSTGLAGVMTVAVKLVARRPRPGEPHVLVHRQLQDSSYPSGHTVHYVTFYGLLFYLAYTMLRNSPLRAALLAITGSLTGLIGASRVYRGEHWPSDVLGAYSFGLGYLVAIIELHRFLKKDDS